MASDIAFLLPILQPMHPLNFTNFYMRYGTRGRYLWGDRYLGLVAERGSSI